MMGNAGKRLYREHSAYLLLQFSWATATDKGGKERAKAVGFVIPQTVM